jgi:ATP-dependent DNA helicase RecG
MQIAYDDARITIKNDPNLESERGKAIKNLLYLMKKEESIRLISVG